MASTLPVSRVVNVSVSLGAKAAATRNFGAMMILGSSQGAITINERIRAYSSISEIASDFGTTSPEYQAAVVYFEQDPTPSTLFIGFWAQSATAGILRGRMLAVSEQDVDNFTGTTSGAVALKVDGVEKKAVALDFSGCSNLNGIASVITTALGGAATVTWTGTRFQVVSATSGASSSVTLSSTAVGGSYTDVSALLGFASGTAIAGVEAESLEACLADLLDFPDWYGVFVAPRSAVSATDAVAAAELISASPIAHIIAFTSQDANEMDSTASNTLGKALKEAGSNRALCIYSSAEPYAAASILGRMATVNFEGSQTAITLKFKQCPGVVAEYLRTSQADALAAKNCNVFANYQNGTAILQEGVMSGGWYIDERHGLDWLQDYLQTALYNLLYTSTTKIGQDEAGMNEIIATCNKALTQAVRNGLLADGAWQGDAFGAIKKGDTIPGFYVYIQPLAEQSQSSREARKAPPIQIACKLKGAVHFVDVSLVVNR